MQYFAIQVRTRFEEKYIKLFECRFPDEACSLHFPRRRLNIRTKGILRSTTAPVFPGYVFIRVEQELNFHLYLALRKTDGFIRFLKSGNKPQPLGGNDLETVVHFLKLGPIAEKSKVYFDTNDKIVVAEGALKGLEGKIVKVDKRKGRAKIKLDLYDNSFSIDLAFEVIGKI